MPKNNTWPLSQVVRRSLECRYRIVIASVCWFGNPMFRAQRNSSYLDGELQGKDSAKKGDQIKAKG